MFHENMDYEEKNVGWQHDLHSDIDAGSDSDQSGAESDSA